MNTGRAAGALLRLSIFNLMRNPGRSAVAILSVLLAAGMTFAGGLITMGADHAMDVGMARLGADLMVVPRGAVEGTHTALVMGEPVAFYMDGGVVDQVRAVPGVREASPQVFVETLASAACCTGRLLVVGFDPETDFTVRPWLYEALHRDLRPDEAVAGNHVTMTASEPLRLYGSEYTVVGRLDPTGMGMDETVFIPMASVAEMVERSRTLADRPLEIPPGSVSAVMVRLADPDRAAEVARAIEEAIPGVSAITAGQVTQGVTRSVSSLMSALVPISAGVFLVSLLLLLVLFSAATMERAREIGILRAMGATARQTVFAFAGEAVLMCLIGALLGVAVGAGVYGLFQDLILYSFTLPFLWPSLAQQVLFAVLVVLGAGALGALAAAWPAWRLARLEPHYSIHGGNT